MGKTSWSFQSLSCTTESLRMCYEHRDNRPVFGHFFHWLSSSGLYTQIKDGLYSGICRSPDPPKFHFYLVTHIPSINIFSPWPRRCLFLSCYWGLFPVLALLSVPSSLFLQTRVRIGRSSGLVYESQLFEIPGLIILCHLSLASLIMLCLYKLWFLPYYFFLKSRHDLPVKRIQVHWPWVMCA